MHLNISDTYNKELPADQNMANYPRQVLKSAYSFVKPKAPKQPELIHTSKAMASAIGFLDNDISSHDFLNVFSGKTTYPNTKPYAMAYAGHQFGQWAGQLGDGRAINLFEVEYKNKRWVLQLKGAGPTPYSRSGDGFAVLRSSIREYLCSEAMHYLGIPTTRALSVMLSGDEVLRDILYNGNAAYEKGAIVCRVAQSFIRFGNFELFASNQDITNLKRLTNYTIKHFYPHLGKPSKDAYIEFYREVTNRTLDLIINWQRVGFVHGVMNTDNMSILGLTIDYGPYGWLDNFDYGWTPNTTDAENKRYRFGNQTNIALWNLLQLANALYPLIEDVKPFESILEGYNIIYANKSLLMMRAKLGLQIENKNDRSLINELEKCFLVSETDMTLFFRLLGNFEKNQPKKGLKLVSKAFYHLDTFDKHIKEKWYNWFKEYHLRLKLEKLSDLERKKIMNSVNPKYVLRNYMAQLAIDAANHGDYGVIDELFQLLKQPYEEQPKKEKWFAKRPKWANHKIGCSMLSCSS